MFSHQQAVQTVFSVPGPLISPVLLPVFRMSFRARSENILPADLQGNSKRQIEEAADKTLFRFYEKDRSWHGQL